jgi:hypothetical protein
MKKALFLIAFFLFLLKQTIVDRIEPVAARNTPPVHILIIFITFAHHGGNHRKSNQ